MSIRLKFLTIFINTIFCCTNVMAQYSTKDIDSLESQLDLVNDSTKAELLLELVDRAQQIDVALMLSYSKRLLQLAKDMDSKGAELAAYHSLSAAYNLMEAHDSAGYYADLGIEFGHENNLDIGQMYHVKGSNLHDMGNIDESVSYFLKSIEYYDSLGSPNAAESRNSLANIYLDRGDHEEAIRLLKRVFQAGEQSDDLQLMAMSTFNMSRAYEEMGDKKSAREMLETSLHYAIISNDSVGIAFNYSRLGAWDLNDGKYYSAIKYLRLCREMFANIHKPQQVKEQDIDIAKAYLGLNKLDSAYQLAYSIYQDDTNPLAYYYTDAVLVLVDIHELQGDFSKALAYQREYSKLNDSAMQSLYNEEVVLLEKTLEKERIEREKNELEARQVEQDLLHRQEMQQQSTIQMVAFGGIGVVVLITLILYASYKRKKRDNDILASKNNKIGLQAEELLSKNDQLEKLSSFKESLTHMIAHDMKNSLNTIIGFSASELSNRKMQGINRSGNVLLNLVTNMLDVQRFEEAEVPLRLGDYPLREIVEEAHQRITLLLEMNSLKLRTTKIPRTLLVKADKEIMIRVLVNLLTNAIKYSEHGETITLRVKIQNGESGRLLELSVIDRGVGISKEKLPHIFDKFWQENAKAAGQAPSTGLGLTFCKLAVEAHGGEIEVESEEGEGTTFRILLPTDVQLEEDLVLEPSSVKEALILDQERAFIMSLQNELKTLEVYQVGSLRRLLKRMDENRIRSRWKLDLEAAIYQSNEQAYKDLVELISN